MQPETVKLLLTSGIQLFLGVGAWFFGWRIARAQIYNQRSDIRIKLFEQRYKVYEAFRDFIAHCAVSDCYEGKELLSFSKNTEKHEFLFGQEIRKYHREIIANALAIRGITENLPCEDVPTIGGVVGYFRGSTVLTDLESLRGWFIRQHTQDLYQYFRPYLDYGAAGVDVSDITMNPPDLPEPPLVRRPIANDKKKPNRK